MNKYFYEGPVMEFDRIITEKWRGETYAVSERKARSNLAYQFKQKHGRMPSSKISIPGEIIKINMEGWTEDD